jgi:hypothetical protein
MSVLVYFVLLFAFVNVKCEENLSNLSIVKTTNGEPWSIPQSMNTSLKRVSIHSDSFNFIYNETSQQCDLLTNGFLR